MLKKIILKILKRQNNRSKQSEIYPADYSKSEIDLFEKVKPYTMTSSERCISLIRSLEHIIESKIEGDIVECGVWRGGSSLIMAEMLEKNKAYNRNIFLYDTFEGMSEATDLDISINNEKASDLLRTRPKLKDDYIWAYASLDDVKTNLSLSQFPFSNIHFIKGKVEDTIPRIIPDKIALLRLDTDWYESTKHELIHLFPKLVKGGILIIDDYGHWQGSKRAVDEYFTEHNVKIFLSRIDYTGRLAIKQ